MALARQKFAVTITFMDTGGDITTRRFDLVTTTPATAITDAANLVAKWAAVTKCTIVKYEINDIFVEGDATLIPPTTPVARVAEVALLNCNLSTPGKHVSLSIPAPVESMFAGTSGPANEEVIYSTEIQDLLNAFVTGVAIAKISDGEVMSANPFNKGERTSGRPGRG